MVMEFSQCKVSPRAMLCGYHMGGASFCGTYMSQMKNLAVIHEFSFTNGPVPSTHILNKHSMYLTKYL